MGEVALHRVISMVWRPIHSEAGGRYRLDLVRLVGCRQVDGPKNGCRFALDKPDPLFNPGSEARVIRDSRPATCRWIPRKYGPVRASQSLVRLPSRIAGWRLLTYTAVHARFYRVAPLDSRAGCTGKRSRRHARVGLPSPKVMSVRGAGPRGCASRVSIDRGTGHDVLEAGGRGWWEEPLDESRRGRCRGPNHPATEAPSHHYPRARRALERRTNGPRSAFLDSAGRRGLRPTILP
jgi:hypothetical protein